QRDQKRHPQNPKAAGQIRGVLEQELHIFNLLDRQRLLFFLGGSRSRSRRGSRSGRRGRLARIGSGLGGAYDRDVGDRDGGQLIERLPLDGLVLGGRFEEPRDPRGQFRFEQEQLVAVERGVER